MPIPLFVWQINFSVKLSVTGDLHKREACLLPQPTVQDVLLRTEWEIRVKRVLANGKGMCVLSMQILACTFDALFMGENRVRKIPRGIFVI